mmetsp:Transcript_8239/g.25418  ORF Transcript_8239/g.25418 Transcript_8239/m.25418 type:complete len:206 (+) Transcript_8239:930-1547(+)
MSVSLVSPMLGQKHEHVTCGLAGPPSAASMSRRRVSASCRAYSSMKSSAAATHASVGRSHTQQLARCTPEPRRVNASPAVSRMGMLSGGRLSMARICSACDEGTRSSLRAMRASSGSPMSSDSSAPSSSAPSSVPPRICPASTRCISVRCACMPGPSLDIVTFSIFPLNMVFLWKVTIPRATHWHAGPPSGRVTGVTSKRVSTQK